MKEDYYSEPPILIRAECTEPKGDCLKRTVMDDKRGYCGRYDTECRWAKECKKE